MRKFITTQRPRWPRTVSSCSLPPVRARWGC